MSTHQEPTRQAPPSVRVRDKIFISYRRSDSQPYAGRIADELRRYFGESRVYRDLDSNRSGADYVAQLQDALAESVVMLALVGPGWLAAPDANGSRRLDDPGDLVRLELEQALAAAVALIPVLVGGAAMPAESDLPRSLRPFQRLHAQPLRDGDWPYDFGRLLEKLEDFGVLPSAPMGDGDTEESLMDNARKLLTKQRTYERTVQATRRRAYDALAGAVTLLRYPQSEASPEAARIRFHAIGKLVSARVVDAGPGRSTLEVEFASLKTSSLAAGAGLSVFMPMLAPVVVAGGIASRAQDRRFATGFLDNVERVLAGESVGEDSARINTFDRIRERFRRV